MSELGALIVEDEPHAQKLLKMLLAEHCPQVDVLASAFSVSEGMAAIEEYQPTLLFLDIELPDGTGFDLLRGSFEWQNERPYVVFTSSHIEYALQAIRKEAFDFLTKPVDEAELVNTIDRIKDRLDRSFGLIADSGTTDRLEIKDRKRCFFVDKKAIVCVKASGSYSEVILRDQKYLVSKNLSILQAQLDPSVFFRGHHSFIVNLREVAEYIYEGGYIKLTTGETLRVAARRKTEFLRAMKGYRG